MGAIELGNTGDRQPRQSLPRWTETFQNDPSRWKLVPSNPRKVTFRSFHGKGLSSYHLRLWRLTSAIPMQQWQTETFAGRKKSIRFQLVPILRVGGVTGPALRMASRALFGHERDSWPGRLILSFSPSRGSLRNEKQKKAHRERDQDTVNRD